MFIFRFLGALLRAIWAGLNTLRRILHLILLLGIFAVLLAGAVGQPQGVPGSAALVIDPSGVIVEQLSGDPLERALADLNDQPPLETLLKDITDSLDRAAADDRITAVVLELDQLQGGGLPKLQAIAAGLRKVQAAGKKVVAVGTSYSRDQYYLAAHADEVLMQDLGIVYLEGYEYYRTYFRDALDKLKVDLNVFRVGEFKSFVEPFIRDDMSPEDREASGQWVNALWGVWVREVTAARELPAGALQSYADELAPRLEAVKGHAAQAALDAGLVDRVMSRPEIDEYLAELAGEGEGDELYSAIDFRAYSVATGLEARLKDSRERKVAVIVASGEIVDGEAAPGTVGGDTLAAEIRDARFDDSVEAVVLRIDSPGGSMLASEVVYDELQALKADGVPVIASMSSVAASGGYYIAMLADEIWASEATITGSIGVGALLPTVQRSLDTLGVHVDGLGTTRLAGQMRLDRPLGDDARRVLAASVEDAYRIFVGKVAEARKLPADKADEVARGRVWIGSDAKALALVDKVGGLEDAIQSAAARAGLDEGSYGVRYVEPEQSVLQRLATELGVRAVRIAERLGLDAPRLARSGLVNQLAARLEQELGTLSRLNDPRGLYLHCLCVVN